MSIWGAFLKFNIRSFIVPHCRITCDLLGFKVALYDFTYARTRVSFALVLNELLICHRLSGRIRSNIFHNGSFRINEGGITIPSSILYHIKIICFIFL